MKTETIKEEDMISLPGDSYALKNFRSKANMELHRDDSVSVRNTIPRYIHQLCAHISAKENVRITRIYPALVHIGYGIKYNEYKSGKDTSLRAIMVGLNKLRLDYNIIDMTFADYVKSCMRFDGELHQYRYPETFASETTELARVCNIYAPDFYLYYFLVGIRHLVESEQSYEHLRKALGYKECIIDLKMAEYGIQLTIDHIDEYLVKR